MKVFYCKFCGKMGTRFDIRKHLKEYHYIICTKGMTLENAKYKSRVTKLTGSLEI